MKIYFERTGGFMGLRMVASFDTDDLPEESAAALHDMLDEVDFFELPARLDSPNPGMDQFHYVLSVSTSSITLIRDDRQHDEDEDDTRQPFMAGEPGSTSPDDSEGHVHTVEFSDAAAPLEMLPLVRMLTRMARGQ